MEEMVYKTKGVCSTRIHLAINDGVLIKVRFESGCDGNLQAISRLVEGMSIGKVIKSLKGIGCDGKSTSCPDQLARALETMEQKQDDLNSVITDETLSD
jgi:uncharacterized protein (TIGR03905 family)